MSQPTASPVAKAPSSPSTQSPVKGRLKKQQAQGFSLSSFLIALSAVVCLAGVTILPSITKVSSPGLPSIFGTISTIFDGYKSDLVGTQSGETQKTGSSPSSAVVTLPAYNPSYEIPTAVFVGGTSGIGLAMAESFAQQTNGSSRIIIVGRNRIAAEGLFARIPSPSTDAPKHEFIECDATLMKNVHVASAHILKTVPKINFLVLTPGVMTMNPRDETEEGIDRKLALHYYARWAFIHGLLPALRKAGEAGEDAKVLSVLGAGRGSDIELDNLGLKADFKVIKAAMQTATYTDLMMEEFSQRNPGISFLHSSPGLVRTNLIRSSDYWMLQMTYPALELMFWPFAISSGQCAEYMWGAIHRSTSGRAWRIGSKGEDIGMLNYRGNEEERKLVWEHTVAEVKPSTIL
ncbi:NAD(P)-binding protein [Pluteus cervinus]|uniref:NAD(P)-binding protein n=1 Tax=Pluteus cervinus TaxID=181527 RepID=A0ACD3B1L0_9AGAR|nr:NAD(P)-binding protein [Pluteus cervinus]